MSAPPFKTKGLCSYISVSPAFDPVMVERGFSNVKSVLNNVIPFVVWEKSITFAPNFKIFIDMTRILTENELNKMVGQSVTDELVNDLLINATNMRQTKDVAEYWQYRSQCERDIDALNLDTDEGRKEFARALMKRNIDNYTLDNTDLEPMLRNMGYRLYDSDFLKIRQEMEMREKWGDALAEEYMNVHDECVRMRLDHHYFDKDHRHENRYGAMIDRNYPLLYSISTFSDYNASIEIHKVYSYGEKYVHILDVAPNVVRLIIQLLKGDIAKKMEWEQKMQWNGDVNLQDIVRQVQPFFPKYSIEVEVGKRQNDGNVKPYEAIVVYDKSYGDNKSYGYCGSLTINKGSDGIARLSCRVPLCGESSYAVTKDKVIDKVREEIESMIH